MVLGHGSEVQSLVLNPVPRSAAPAPNPPPWPVSPQVPCAECLLCWQPRQELRGLGEQAREGAHAPSVQRPAATCGARGSALHGPEAGRTDARAPELLVVHRRVLAASLASTGRMPGAPSPAFPEAAGGRRPRAGCWTRCCHPGCLSRWLHREGPPRGPQGLVACPPSADPSWRRALQAGRVPAAPPPLAPPARLSAVASAAGLWLKGKCLQLRRPLDRTGYKGPVWPPVTRTGAEPSRAPAGWGRRCHPHFLRSVR